MAIVIELVGDQLTKGKSPRGRLRYHVQGATTATEAYLLVNAASPVSLRTCRSHGVRIAAPSPSLRALNR